jgi:hypothetical protein
LPAPKAEQAAKKDLKSLKQKRPLCSQVEKLPANERKQIVQILDAFLEREKLKKDAG